MMLPNRSCPFIVSLALLAACVPEGATTVSHQLAHRDHDVDRVQQGIVACNPRPAVGYEVGTPFSMTIVDADGRPAEISTANAYDLMQQDARRNGVYLQVASGFRSYEEQAYLYQCYLNCSCNQCNLAAAPGYSNHNSGYALDINTHAPGVLNWLNRNASRFGFARTVPSEPWHWEYFGGTRHSPCAPSGNSAPPPTSLVQFQTPSDGGHYTNGVWMKVRAQGATMVEYESDGFVLGASEDASDDFALRYTFHQTGRRIIEATAYDVSGDLLGRSSIEILVVEGDTPQSISFVAPSHRGWYRNGVWMRVDVPAATREVAYYAGPYLLGRSVDAADRFGLRYVFGSLGRRALLAVAYDQSGREIARRSIAIRVLPGDEAYGAAIELIAPDEDGQLDNGSPIRVVASDSIVEVRYDADGYTMGSSSAAGANFELHYTFTQSGDRRLRARGYNQSGALVAETVRTVTVR